MSELTIHMRNHHTHQHAVALLFLSRLRSPPSKRALDVGVEVAASSRGNEGSYELFIRPVVDIDPVDELSLPALDALCPALPLSAEQTGRILALKIHSG